LHFQQPIEFASRNPPVHQRRMQRALRMPDIEKGLAVPRRPGDGRALDTIAISREYDRDEDEGRRATRIGEMIEQVLEGRLRLPDVVARKAAGRSKVRPFAVEPEVIINNQWSDRYTVIEVSGLDRPGLLYQLTTAISKLNLNIASAHVATFGERARDVFYVTDLLGAQINAPTRQAAIKSALIHLLASEDDAAQPAA
jgi:[protein-PII] uridylyltransferase